jgi:hypothetical protein
MHPVRSRSVSGLLLLLLTVACTSPQTTTPNDGVPHPRVWLGLALAGDGSAPNSVVIAADGASAAEAGIQAGDILVNLAGRRILGPTELAETVETLPAREVVEAVVKRNGEVLPLPIDPGVLLSVKEPPVSRVDDKKCDDECDCSVDEPGAICFHRLVYSGPGPNGGVLYRIGCAAVKGEDIVSDQDCGTKEFF